MDRESPPDYVTLSIASWTDGEIVIQGFTGEYGQNNWTLNNGDQLTVNVWNPQTGAGPSTCMQTVGADSLPCALTITFDGNDVIGTTQAVVVGQRISLAATLSNGGTCESPSWSVEGDTVGGFKVSPSYELPRMGAVIPTDFTQSSTTFYWVNGGGFLVTASCALNGQTLSSQVIFNVDTPDITNVFTSFGTINVTNDDPFCPGTCLKLGGSPSNRGVAFKVEPANIAGHYQWLQLLDGCEIKRYRFKTLVERCLAQSGLDTSDPYRSLSPDETEDNPGAQLMLPFTTESEVMSARMYLMWNRTLPSGCILPGAGIGAGTCTSISIPLGFVDWSWSGAAKYEPLRKEWELLDGASSTKASAFEPTTTFPTWTRLDKSCLVVTND